MFVKAEKWFLWLQHAFMLKKFVRQFLDLFAAFINIKDEVRHLFSIYIKLTKTWRDSLTGMQVYLECVLQNVVICNCSQQATNYYDKDQYSVIRRSNLTHNLFVLNCFCIVEVWFFFLNQLRIFT